MFRLLIFAFVTTITLGTSFFRSVAAEFATLVDEYRLESFAMHDKLVAQEALLGAPESEWRDIDVENYLYYAFWTVFNATVAYKLDRDRLPTNLQDVVDEGYAPGWPKNPFNGWEPMSVLSPADGFSPGNFVLLECPVEFWSVAGRIDSTTLRPMSFELGIFGPTEEFARLGSAAPLDTNSWASVPKGTLYMAGSHRESASVTAEKLQEKIAMTIEASKEQTP